MIELIYFGMMPIIIFIVAVLYHLDIDILEFKTDRDGRLILGAPFMLAIWPLILAAGIFALILFVIIVSINWLAKKVASKIKKGAVQ